MRNPGSITVTKAMMHVIDHHNYPHPLLSDDLVNLAAQPTLVDYLQGQINNTLTDRAALKARFRSPEENETAEHCHKILRNSRSLPGSSKALAELLFNASQQNPRISVGTLAVCTYSSTAYPSTQFLALIKIDISNVFIQETEINPEEYRVANYKLRKDILPNLEKRLQKAALVRPPDPANKYDLLLLDRQMPGAPAHFFVDSFLNCKLAEAPPPLPPPPPPIPPVPKVDDALLEEKLRFRGQCGIRGEFDAKSLLAIDFKMRNVRKADGSVVPRVYMDVPDFKWV